MRPYVTHRDHCVAQVDPGRHWYSGTMQPPLGTPDFHPIIRPAARLLVLDSRDRLLLFRTSGIGAPFIWLPPGGGLWPDETYEQAALRELWEGTGLVAPLSPCVWRRSFVYHKAGRRYEARERFYVARVDGQAIRDDHREDHERVEILAHRWWFLDEIAVSAEIFVPARLAQLLAPLLAGAYPAEPITVDA